MSSRRRETLELELERRFIEGARLTGEFFIGESEVQKALQQLAERLDRLGIPYAILGALDSLPAEFAEELDPYVRAKFSELWRAAQSSEHD